MRDRGHVIFICLCSSIVGSLHRYVSRESFFFLNMVGVLVFLATPLSHMPFSGICLMCSATFTLFLGSILFVENTVNALLFTNHSHALHHHARTYFAILRFIIIDGKHTLAG